MSGFGLMLTGLLILGSIIATEILARSDRANLRRCLEDVRRELAEHWGTDNGR